MEILRRKIQFLDLGSVEKNRILSRLLLDVAEAFATDRGDLAPELRIWRSDQRAIGELMLTETGGVNERGECLGYAAFLVKMEEDKRLQGLFGRLEADIGRMAADAHRRSRSIRLQRALIDLIDFLDDDRSRFPLDLRGKVPLGDPISPGEARSKLALEPQRPAQARFRFTKAPWSYLDDWAQACSFRRAPPAQGPPEQPVSYVMANRFGMIKVVDAKWDQRWLEITAYIKPPRWASPFTAAAYSELRPEDRGVIFSSSRRRLLKDVNVLLQMFDRPLIRRTGGRRA